jgi:DegV family protein with EDD domain
LQTSSLNVRNDIFIKTGKEMTVHIVTDSTSDLPDSIIDSLPITVVPVHVMLNGKSYLDRVDLPRESFYEALPESDPHPTTAAPSPGKFIEVYEQAADAGAEAVISIHVAAAFSAIFQSAKVAASQYDRIPVYPIDSGNLTLAEGLVVIKAAQAAQAGDPVEAILEEVNAVIPRTFAYAKLDTIDYLQRSGRMSSIQHTVIGLLGIKPIMRMNNHVAKMEVARTRSRAYERVLAVAAEAAPQAELFGISHANVPDQARQLIHDLRKVHPDLEEPIVSEVTPALGVHVGPGSLCINWIEDPEAAAPEKKGWRRWFR